MYNNRTQRVVRAFLFMRVLMFGWEFPPYNSGGLGVACRGLSRALISEGVELSFVLPVRMPVALPECTFLFAYESEEWEHFFGTKDTVGAYLSAGEAEYLSDALRHLLPELHGSLFAQVLAYARRARALARRARPDIIHAHDWLTFLAGIIAKEETSVPLVVHIHATEFDRTGNGRVNEAVYAIEKRGMEMADRVIAVSEYTKRMLVARYGIPPQKIDVVYNAIDHDEIEASHDVARVHALKKAGKKIVLFVGRLTLQKGPDHFLRIAARVAEQVPEAVFVIAGSGDMERQVIKEAAYRQMGDKIIFAGFMRDADRTRLYAQADCFVMPSVSEPFGIVPLEALANGVPVVISKQSGVREVLRHALCADFWDIDAFADSIIGVLKRPVLHGMLSREGKKEVRGIVWKRAAEHTLRIYRRLKNLFRV